MKRTVSNIILILCAVALMLGVSWADTLKVGVQAPITGSYANEGQGIENGARLLASQINSAGGVMGKQVEVIVCDDQGDRNGRSNLRQKPGQQRCFHGYRFLHLDLR